MTYVYMLSDYDEHGSENCAATLDRNRLLSMIDENWPKIDFNSRPAYASNPQFYADRQLQWMEQAKASLTKLLDQTDEDLAQGSGHNLHDGWGGAQLHVIKLR
jgi:hypothetical protein